MPFSRPSPLTKACFHAYVPNLYNHYAMHTVCIQLSSEQRRKLLPTITTHIFLQPELIICTCKNGYLINVSVCRICIYLSSNALSGSPWPSDTISCRNLLRPENAALRTSLPSNVVVTRGNFVGLRRRKPAPIWKRKSKRIKRHKAGGGEAWRRLLEGGWAYG